MSRPVHTRVGDNDKQLHTLQRWRALELEQARVEHARQLEAARTVREAVAGIERAIDETQRAAHARLADPRPPRVEELRRLGEYVAWQAAELTVRRQELQAQEATAEETRRQVVQRFEALSSVERLRERAQRDRAVAELRREQKLIDEQALRRLAWRSTQSV